MPVHTSTRRPSTKRRTSVSPPARKAVEMKALTEEWWSSWRRANALAWDYLDAVSGLMRLNMSAFTRASMFLPTLPTLPFAQQQ
jgi:hypothetical protein